MEKFLKSIGFMVVVSIDQDKDAIDEAFSSLLQMARKQTLSLNINKKILFFIYYSGHGYMENETFGITTIDEDIPIDQYGLKLAKYPNTYTIGFFDCCRTKR
jgi:hypothetical protein